MTDTDEIILRVGSFEPLRWQCIVRPRDRQRGWSVGVAATPVDALHTALAEAGYCETPAPPVARVRKRTR